MVHGRQRSQGPSARTDGVGAKRQQVTSQVERVVRFPMNPCLLARAEIAAPGGFRVSRYDLAGRAKYTTLTLSPNYLTISLYWFKYVDLFALRPKPVRDNLVI